MQKPHALDLPPLNCELDAELGDYYQDIAAAIGLVESGYHGGMSEDGIPLADYATQGRFANPVISSQYALANMIAAARGEPERLDRARTQLDWLIETQATAGQFAGCWMMEHDNPKYPWLRAPWTSALASGNAISALLRGWQLFDVDRYRAAADDAYRALHEPGIGLTSGDGDELWYEEYPADPPLHVLNGHVYALLGVVDYARATGDPEAEARWRRAASTTLAHLEGFDLGFWSAYDLLWREPASLHYQKNIHIPQLRILAKLTGDQPFEDMAERWERQLSSPLARIRWHAALRVYARRKQRRSAGDIPANSVGLRPFPYPYRAGLSLCNDADSLTVEAYKRLRAFLQTDAETEWGPGLGLDVGGSWFMYRSPDSPNRFTVFDRLTPTVTDDGAFILDCIRAGDLDVLHTYGCFTNPAHFTRSMAQAALETLRNHGITVETWVNHGPPLTNVQCIGSHDGWEGDLPGSGAYHADLLTKHGVRWFWTGDEIVDRMPMDAAHPRYRRDRGRQLVRPSTLRDGQTVAHFYRYAGLGGATPVLDDLPRQLSDKHLDELVAAGAYAIVYQHLAVRRARPGFGTQAYAPVDGAWFRPEEIQALRALSRRFHEGEIWVVPTSRLLRYRDAHQSLRWEVRREAGGDAVIIDVDDASHASALADITFWCERPRDTTVYLRTTGGLQRVDAVRINPADETGRASVTIQPAVRDPRHG
jgi:hypothetical protein